MLLPLSRFKLSQLTINLDDVSHRKQRVLANATLRFCFSHSSINLATEHLRNTNITARQLTVQHFKSIDIMKSTEFLQKNGRYQYIPTFERGFKHDWPKEFFAEAK